MENKEIERLRNKWNAAINSGEFQHLSTDEMKVLADNMKQAADALFLFPECRSTQTWLFLEEQRLRDYIRNREGHNYVHFKNEK